MAAEPASALPHFAFFSVLLLSAAVAGFALVEPVEWARAAVPIASLIEFLLVVPLLAWQTARRFPTALKTAAWAAAARWFAIQTPAWVLQYKAALVDKTSRDISPWATPLGSGWIGWLNFTSLVVIGLTGAYFAITAGRDSAHSAGETQI
jgi:hypothetical protein